MISSSLSAFGRAERSRLRKDLAGRGRVVLNVEQRAVDAQDRQAVVEIVVPGLRAHPREVVHHEIRREESRDAEAVGHRRAVDVEPRACNILRSSAKPCASGSVCGDGAR